MQVSAKQIKFFDNLLEVKEFGAADKAALKTQFASLNKASASEWIDKAVKLPDEGEENETVTAPAF